MWQTQSRNWTTTYFRPQVSHRNTTVCSPALTTGRNRAYVLYPIGRKPNPNPAGLDDFQHRHFVPFTVQELFQSGEALYYGLNALSNNMILCDRKRLKNPNGLILGTPGSGKSFSAKREITNAFLITADDIIICDPEAEYYPLVERLKGRLSRFRRTARSTLTRWI